jgi:16S rRNA (uracil1498-N3)-methyltransferase
MAAMTGDPMDLTYPGGGVRLFVEGNLSASIELALADGQSHYLAHVLRAQIGMRLSVFNGRDGEWSAAVERIAKRGVTVRTIARIKDQEGVPDIWLLLAPVKRTPLDYVVQKASELGAARIWPVLTRRTIVDRVNGARLRANAIEAAEQSGRLCVPQTPEPVALERALDGWDQDRALFFCDEGGDALPLADASRLSAAQRFAILTGPEGGFEPGERAVLRRQIFVTPVTLGPRILRADTAALAALAILQSTRGDWT